MVLPYHGQVSHRREDGAWRRHGDTIRQPKTEFRNSATDQFLDSTQGGDLAHSEALRLGRQTHPNPALRNRLGLGRGYDLRIGDSIGIGGRLAAPPIPHHRAYGSVPRRFDRIKLGQRHEVEGDRETRSNGCAELVGPPGVLTCARIPSVNRRQPQPNFGTP